MKFLLYCILQSPGDGILTMPECPNGHPLHIIENHGLCAAVGDVSDSGSVRTTAEIVEYHGIIAWFHDQVAVIPFRFGTILDARADVERLLERKAGQYAELLQELEGCSEMGIRAIGEEPRRPNPPRDKGNDVPGASSENPGTLYLSRLKLRHQHAHAATQADERTIERYRAPFDGIFRKFRSEVSRSQGTNGSADSVIRSLYFLVPKQSLHRFRQTFAELAAREDARLLLSGPWPPYNFVLSADRAPK
jgi:hypothetical protein